MRKSRKTYWARHASLEVEGANKSEANEKLERMIDWALEHHAPFIESRYGYVLIGAATATGWQSTLLTPDDIAAHGKRKDCVSFQGQIERDLVIRSLRMHAAQNAWMPECDDARHVAASGLSEIDQCDLLSWIGFQRKYANAKAAGRTDAEAFDIANGRMVA